MIRKLALLALTGTLCFVFNACEMHKADQILSDYPQDQPAKKESADVGTQPQSTNPNAPQFFSSPKAN